MDYVDRYRFGDGEQMSLRMVPCLALTPDEKHFADADEEPAHESRQVRRARERAERKAADKLDMRLAAKAYLDAGYEIVVLEPGLKLTRVPDWPNIVFTLDDVQPNSNLGLKGVPLVVDIDCQLALQCADDLLPRTPRIDGRPGKKRSHRAYVADLPSEDFKHLDGTMIVQILAGRGKQAVVPPSLWVNNGHQERREWDDGSIIGPQAATVDPPFLRSRVVWQATVALIARHWPPKGIRRTLRLAYARVLLETLKLEPHVAGSLLGWACRLGGSDDDGIKHAASLARCAIRSRRSTKVNAPPAHPPSRNCCPRARS